MPPVVVYRTPFCSYCFRVKHLLESKGVPFTEVDVSGDQDKRQWLAEITRQRTVPQVFIDGEPVGGFDDLARLNRSGELDRLLGCRHLDSTAAQPTHPPSSGSGGAFARTEAERTSRT